MSEKSESVDQISHLTTAEVAKKLGVAIRSVQLMVDRGELEAWKTPGGHRRITQASVAAWQSRQPSFGDQTLAPSLHPKPKLRILLIEDSVHFQNLVQLLIQRHFPDVELHVAHDGITGMALYGQVQPDVMLVDILLPDINGASLITALKTHARFAQCKLLVITSMDGEERRPYEFALEGVPILHKTRLVQDFPQALKDLLAS
ncbi:helix-turn-helix domain-containing protein [Comamonas testosteroni]|uniref:helix-turn-helix domain-containing protein n=1 Tax=Comamonas testosteroni TaxID=285 RepID=UPI0005B47EC3|nr:helix-turn-helix domain-containing protein [Comamonas testosteroni]